MRQEETRKPNLIRLPRRSFDDPRREVSTIYISTQNRTHNLDISAVLGPPLRECTSSLAPVDLGADRQLHLKVRALSGALIQSKCNCRASRRCASRWLARGQSPPLALVFEL